MPLVKKLTNITTPAVLDHDTERGGIGRHHPPHWHYARMWSGNQTKRVSVVHHAWECNSRHPKTHRNPFMTAASPMKSPLTSTRSASVMPVVDSFFSTTSSAAYLVRMGEMAQAETPYSVQRCGSRRLTFTVLYG